MAAHQAPSSLGFSRQEYWSGLPFLSPMHESEKWKWSHSVASDSSQPHGPQPTRLLCPWDFPGKIPGVGCHCLLLKKVEHRRIDAFELFSWIRLLENPLDRKEIQPVHPKLNQSQIFIGRTATEAETPILWPPDVKNWLIWKDPDAGKDWRQEKGKTEDEFVGWHHQLNWHESE